MYKTEKPVKNRLLRNLFRYAILFSESRQNPVKIQALCNGYISYPSSSAAVVFGGYLSL